MSADEHDRYAREVMDVATAQWCAAGLGLLGAVLVLATVTELGPRVPRMLMLLALVGGLLAVGAGATIMVVDGFAGLGLGWRWYHGVLVCRGRTAGGDDPFLRPGDGRPAWLGLTARG